MRQRLFQGQKPGTADILGARIDLIDYSSTLNAIDHAISEKQQIAIGFTNVYTIMCAQRDQTLMQAIHSFSLSVPDGMPLVWLSRFTDQPIKSRVYGPDLFLATCAHANGSYSGYRHFFYGSTPDVLSRLEHRMRQQFPDIQIAGTLSPPFRDLTLAEEQDFIDKIEASKADILWVAIGSPKQEKWMAEMRPRLSVPVMAAVGAAFEFHAGTKKQAKPFIRNSGFEWLFRLMAEPQRMASRYLINNPLFILAVMRQAILRLVR